MFQGAQKQVLVVDMASKFVPDLSSNKHLRDLLDKQVWSLEASPRDLPVLKAVLQTAQCLIPQHSFRGLERTAPTWVRAVLEAEQRFWTGVCLFLHGTFLYGRAVIAKGIKCWIITTLFSVLQCNEGCIKAYLHMGKAYLALKKYNEVSIITSYYMQSCFIHKLLF